MNQYITGDIIKKLREEKKKTQAQLADILNVSDKAVSKWENGHGFPDISLLEPLAKALGLSVTELLAGESIRNTNRTFNMRKIKFYICPICGNVIISTGESVVNCCGIRLPELEAEPADDVHRIKLEMIEDEYYVSVLHEMSREHYISFIMAAKDNGYEMTKLYPEGSSESRFKIERTECIYFYCNKHGLFKYKLPVK